MKSRSIVRYVRVICPIWNRWSIHHFIASLQYATNNGINGNKRTIYQHIHVSLDLHLNSRYLLFAFFRGDPGFPSPRVQGISLRLWVYPRQHSLSRGPGVWQDLPVSWLYRLPYLKHKTQCENFMLLIRICQPTGSGKQDYLKKTISSDWSIAMRYSSDDDLQNGKERFIKVKYREKRRATESLVAGEHTINL